MANPASLGTDPVYAVSAAADRILISTLGNFDLKWDTDGEAFGTVSAPNAAMDLANDGTNFAGVIEFDISGAGQCWVYRFTWSSKTLDSGTSVFVPVNGIGSFEPLIVRRTSDYVIFHEDDSEKVHGTDYSRFQASYGTPPSSWTQVTNSIGNGAQNDAKVFTAVAATDGRVHVGYAVAAASEITNVRQFTTSNTWAGSDDTFGLTGQQGTPSGRRVGIQVSSNEYVMWHSQQLSSFLFQAQSQASTTWNERTVQGETEPGAVCTFDGNVRNVWWDNSASEMQYRESTDGGVTWDSSDQTLATTTDLGHTPPDNSLQLAVGWSIGGTEAMSIIYLGPSSTYYHYYITAAVAGAQPQKRPILNFINNLVR